jgi:hypothetical protein
LTVEKIEIYLFDGQQGDQSRLGWGTPETKDQKGRILPVVGTITIELSTIGTPDVRIAVSPRSIFGFYVE